ncbi:MAG: GNAT family N-acetyltransferase [Magnetospirillum sp.]|nr:MAG: GNAT family N-acetyltransferase [Magnetospirillum sp.]
MPLTIRPATQGDSPDIFRLIRLQAAFEGGEVALTEDTIRRDAFGPHPRFTALLAEADTVVGMVVLFEGYSSWAGRPTLVVHDLFVEDAVRGTGAGRALLAAAEALANERGCCRLDVNVLGWNTPARRFYERLGFEALAEWLPYRKGL